MTRLTADIPDGNWETMLNFVFGQGGWAHIRYDGENENVPLTQWAKAQCLRNGCGEFSAETPQEIDEEISDCMMDFPDCPIALAYCFAVQACHLRSRLKLYEDILFDETGKERLALDALRRLVGPSAPLTQEQLREMSEEPVWFEFDDFCGWSTIRYANSEFLATWRFGFLLWEEYGKTWRAYRRQPEECLASWQDWLRSRFERAEG